MSERTLVSFIILDQHHERFIVKLRHRICTNAIIINSCYSNYLVNFLCKNISFAPKPRRLHSSVAVDPYIHV